LHTAPVKNGEPSKNADGSYIIPDELIEQTSRLTYQYNNNHAQVFLDGTDLTNNLRTQECALAASRLSSNPRIRHGLMALQRSLGKTT
jgi:cytidylate kinase